MIMKFKKIYIEITNKCNLNCSFCSKDKRELKSISVKDFEKIMIKINNYTDFICLHKNIIKKLLLQQMEHY